MPRASNSPTSTSFRPPRATARALAPYLEAARRCDSTDGIAMSLAVGDLASALFELVHDAQQRDPLHAHQLIDWLAAQVGTLSPEARQWMRVDTASQLATLAALSAVCARI